jgi:hypothetical protein
MSALDITAIYGDRGGSKNKTPAQSAMTRAGATKRICNVRLKSRSKLNPALHRQLSNDQVERRGIASTQDEAALS